MTARCCSEHWHVPFERLQVSNDVAWKASVLIRFCNFVINMDFVVQNLTDSHNTSKERDLCPSKKVNAAFHFQHHGQGCNINSNILHG